MSDDLDPRVARSLASLRKDSAPSPGLEGRVLDEIRAEGLVRHTGRHILPALGWAALLASVFVAGILVGDRRGGPVERVSGDRYLLLLLEGPGYRTPGTPDAERARVAEYAAWAGDLERTGRFVEGQKLDDALERLGKPASPGEEIVAGYFVIEAANMREALRITRTIPHLGYGGSVEVRRIDGGGS